MTDGSFTPPDGGDGDGGWASPGAEPDPGVWAPPTAMPPPGPGGDAAWSGGRMIPLRPMRLGEILDASFKLFRSTIVQAVLLVAITLGAITILSSFIQPTMPGLLSDPAELESFDLLADPTTFLVRYGIYFLVTMVMQLVLYPIVRGGVTGIALAADRGGDSSWQAGLRLGFALAGRLLGLAFLLLGFGVIGMVVLGVVLVVPVVLIFQSGATAIGVIVALLAVLAFIAVLIVATALIRLSVPIVVVEHASPMGALRRSVDLVRPQLMRIIGIVVVTTIMIGAIGGVLGVLSVPFALIGGRVGQLATAVLSTVSLLVTVPLEANIGLLLYVDARVRLEGLDVAVLTAELDRA